MYRFSLLGILFFAAFAGPARADEPVDKAEFKQLQGKHKVTYIAFKRADNVKRNENSTVVIDEKGLTCSEGDLGTLKIVRLESGKPFGKIDFVAGGKKYAGIYRVTDHKEVQICFVEGEDRPTDIDSRPTNYLLTFEPISTGR